MPIYTRFGAVDLGADLGASAGAPSFYKSESHTSDFVPLEWCSHYRTGKILFGTTYNGYW